MRVFSFVHTRLPVSSSNSGTWMIASPEAGIFVLQCRRRVDPAELPADDGDETDEEPVAVFSCNGEGGGNEFFDVITAAALILAVAFSLDSAVAKSAAFLCVGKAGGIEAAVAAAVVGTEFMRPIILLLLSGSIAGNVGSICWRMERIVSCSTTQNCRPLSNSVFNFLAVRAFIISFFNVSSSACCSSNDAVDSPSAIAFFPVPALTVCRARCFLIR